MPDNFTHGDDEMMIVSYGFMRTLTRELDEAEAEIARLRVALDGLMATAFVGESFKTTNGIPMAMSSRARMALRKVRAALAGGSE